MIIESTIVYAVSVAVATMYIFLIRWGRKATNWEFAGYWNKLSIVFWSLNISVLGIPTLIISGMCVGVWWNKLLPRKNARYRSLTMFFARLLASAYIMAIGSAVRLTLGSWGITSDAYQFTISGFYLIGFVQMCLAVTKKDIRDAFVGLWCCRKRDNGAKSSTTTFGGTARSTLRDSYAPEEVNNDEVHSAVDDATSSEVNSPVVNQDIDQIENEGNEATATSSSVDFDDERIKVNIDIDQAGTYLAEIDETENEIAMSRVNSSVQV